MATPVVYDPPLSRLPYLAVEFLPNGTLEVKSFKSASKADAYAAKVAKLTKRPKRQSGRPQRA
jgi:hypothetical protein